MWTLLRCVRLGALEKGTVSAHFTIAEAESWTAATAWKSLPSYRVPDADRAPRQLQKARSWSYCYQSSR